MKSVNATDSRSSSVCSAAERTDTWSDGQLRFELGDELLGRGALRGRDGNLVELALAVEEPLGLGDREDGERRRCRASWTSPYCARPVTVNSSTGWIVAISIVSPIL